MDALAKRRTVCGFQVQLAADDGAGDTVAQQFVDRGEAFAGADGQTRLRALGRRLRGVLRCGGGFVLVGRGIRLDPVGPVGHDDLLDRLAEVVPQVPAVSYLDRVGGAFADGFRVGAGTIPADNLHAGVACSQPATVSFVRSGSTSIGGPVAASMRMVA